MEVIPEAAAVIAAAEAFVDNGGPSFNAALTEAVEAFRMRRSRPVGAVTYEEQNRVWGEVVEGDEILSAKTNRWYEVIRTVVNERDSTIKVSIKNAPHKPIIRPIGDPVRVKRGVAGDAVDLFQLLWSDSYDPRGIHRAASITGTGPVITEEEDSDA